MRWTCACAATLAALFVMTGDSPARSEAAGEVNIYSFRQPYLIEPLLEEFSEETGIKTNVIFASKGLIERIQAEGRNSPADLLLTTDIGNLSQAVASGISQPVVSDTIDSAIPETYRGTNDEWIGLTGRARVVYASKERVDQDSITYEELADPKWRGKICIRSGQHPYNVALVASMLAHLGRETEAWLRGVKENLARKPAGDDRLQVKGVYAGECDLAIGNTYYMGKMLTDEKHPEQKEWAESVKILFPNTAGRGTHVNVSGVVLAKNAPNKDNALKLIEFLASDKGQTMYAEVNHEYPTKEGVAWSDLVESWGTFKADTVSLNEIADMRRAASEMIDKVGFNDGPSS
ncbi:iron ABC transporter substrate-binding protein [Methyloceanibacter methanicus]|uniref:Iron ABC transporter substrate-binding protein n=1 Tax=Methyloceanibacter methanicus TaxID=1774968 RepID=A0A1E3W2U0_9HYPH|nr:Fe(3+) ABC transporter substrate-binding protein [Methyloceanibacter methanicus]ODS00129.1 iron ABC transporter substrate-binding protein [Methyloceanibacter methanicus]